MKKILSAIVLLFLCVSAMTAQQQRKELVLLGKEKTNQFVFFEETYISGGFVRPMGAPDGFETKFLGTMEGQIGLFGFAYKHDKWNFDLRMDFTLSSYRLKGDNYLAANRKGDAYLQKYPDGTDDHKAWLFAYGSETSLMAYYTMKDDDRFGFGLIDYANRGFSKVSYKDIDDEKTTQLYNMTGFNSRGVGIKIEYWLDDISFYLKYKPTHFIHKNHGPAFSTLSFGVGFH